MYVMIAGRLQSVGNFDQKQYPTIKVLKIANLSSNLQSEMLWMVEVIDAQSKSGINRKQKYTIYGYFHFHFPFFFFFFCIYSLTNPPHTVALPRQNVMTENLDDDSEVLYSKALKGNECAHRIIVQFLLPREQSKSELGIFSHQTEASVHTVIYHA